MTPERAAELADEAWRKFCASECWNTLDATLPIKQAILAACKEERADVLKGEFICARCSLRKDSGYEMKYDF